MHYILYNTFFWSLFWSNPYEIEVMLASLIEMLELPKSGHMITSTI